jgi:hypothetical protein
MSYITYLKSLPDEARANEIKNMILGAQRALLKDQSRTKLLDYNDLNCWDEIDEFKLEQVRFDDTTCERIAETFWQSSGPKDEDDERQMYGNATATIARTRPWSFLTPPLASRATLRGRSRKTPTMRTNNRGSKTSKTTPRISLRIGDVTRNEMTATAGGWDRMRHEL